MNMPAPNSSDLSVQVKGRFAPSPTGRMHLGNIFTAVISWLSVKKAGGKWILRIEDLDPQRSKPEYARQIEDDLDWLGLNWDEGGTADIGANGPYSQSHRDDIYRKCLERLQLTGWTYPCYCTRADIMATQAPHQTDGRVIYSGRCRPTRLPAPASNQSPDRPHATRLYVPDQDITFIDRVYGSQTVNLSTHCGDFVLQRADGAWAYQMAVVIDDALMGVTEVVRGNDLLLSTAQQLYLYRLLGMQAPQFAHLPLICNSRHQRLSKRDLAMSMSEIRLHHTSAEVIGRILHMAGLTSDYAPCKPEHAIELFDWSKISKTDTIIIQ